MIRALRRRHLRLAGGSSLAAATVLVAGLAVRVSAPVAPPPAPLAGPLPPEAVSAGRWIELASGAVRARRIENDAGSWIEIEPVAPGQPPALQVFLSPDEIADPTRVPARARWLGDFEGARRRFFALPSAAPGATLALYDPLEGVLRAQAPLPAPGEG